MSETLNRGRQWPTNPFASAPHHYIRYIFASDLSRGRILDAACGAGYGSLLLSIGEADVVGVDKSEEAIRWARKFFPGPKYICGDIKDCPWEGKFETVVSLETIEHVPDPSGLLKALRSACDGIFIVSVPNEERYPFRAESFAEDEFPHFRHYTPAEFDELLDSHGFRVFGRFTQKEKLQPEIVEGTDGKFLIYACKPKQASPA